MEELIKDHCSSEDLQIYEQIYNDEKSKGKVSTATVFNYASFLVRSQYNGDIQRGIHLLEKLYEDKANCGKRDFVYYIAIGYARLKKYELALHYADGLLKTEPENRQISNLRNYIFKLSSKEKQKEAAIAGGALVLVGGLVGLGIAALTRK